MKRTLAGIMASLGLLLLCVSVSMAQPAPEFKLGFKALADQISDVVGQPVEEEHYGPNGDSLQKTTTGLMVWRKADNWTAFTDGSRSWVNGPFGVMERANEDRFEWEDAAPVSTPAPAVAVPSTPTPATTPTPVAPAQPRVTAGNPNIVKGEVVYGATVWVFGEVRNEGAAPAYNVRVSGRLMSAAGTVAGADDDTIPIVGPGDVVAYAIDVKNPSPYVKAEVSVSSQSNPPSMTYMKGNLSGTALRKTSDSVRFAGIVTNGNAVAMRNMQVRAWFLDAQGVVVDVTTDYFHGDLAPGATANFDAAGHTTRYNPKVGSVTQSRAYVWGYK